MKEITIHFLLLYLFMEVIHSPYVIFVECTQNQSKTKFIIDCSSGLSSALTQNHP